MTTSCASPGCNNTTTSRLACPKCVSLGLPAPYFCSQECFKSNYAEHKKVHSIALQILNAKADLSSGTVVKDGATPQERLALPSWAHNYSFTGLLRPAMQSPRRVIPSHIRHPDYAKRSDGVSESEQADRTSNTSIKIFRDPQEIADMKHACAMGREVLDLAGRAVRPGVTTDEIDRIVHEACIERDCYPSPLNYYQFPKSVCTSINEVICHGIPDYRELQEGDIVNIDVTTYTRGYHGDLNESFFVGKVSSDKQNVVETSYKSLKAALDMVRPGVLYRDLGSAITKVATKNKCSVNKTYCGHGIGTLFHTSPNIPHYNKNKAKGTIKEGHVFTVEPMINVGIANDISWSDNWTAVTVDGKPSAQFEHTVLVTKDGIDILTAREEHKVDGCCFQMAEWDSQIFQR